MDHLARAGHGEGKFSPVGEPWRHQLNAQNEPISSFVMQNPLK
jgi:hypothetical protein